MAAEGWAGKGYDAGYAGTNICGIPAHVLAVIYEILTYNLLFFSLQKMITYQYYILSMEYQYCQDHQHQRAQRVQCQKQCLRVWRGSRVAIRMPMQIFSCFFSLSFQLPLMIYSFFSFLFFLFFFFFYF